MSAPSSPAPDQPAAEKADWLKEINKRTRDAHRAIAALDTVVLQNIAELETQATEYYEHMVRANQEAAAAAARAAALEEQLSAERRGREEAEAARAAHAERAAASAAAVKIAAADYTEAQQALARRDAEIGELRAQLRRRIESDAMLLAALPGTSAPKRSRPASSSSSASAAAAAVAPAPKAATKAATLRPAKSGRPRKARRISDSVREEVLDIIESVLDDAAAANPPHTVSASDILAHCELESVVPLPSRSAVGRWLAAAVARRPPVDHHAAPAAASAAVTDSDTTDDEMDAGEACVRLVEMATHPDQLGESWLDFA